MAVEAPDAAIAEPTAHVDARSAAVGAPRVPARSVLLAAGLIVAAAALLVAGRVQRSHAAETRTRERQVARQAKELETTYAADQRRLGAIRASAAQAQDSVAALLDAFRADVSASNRVADVTNRASDLFNSGQIAPAADLLKGDGTAAATALDQASKAAQRALLDTQRSLGALQAVSGG